MDHRQGPDADGRRQHVGRGVTQSRSENLRPDPPDGAGHLRRTSARASQARRTLGEKRFRVRLHHAAVEAAGCHRLDGRTDRGPMRLASWADTAPRRPAGAEAAVIVPRLPPPLPTPSIGCMDAALTMDDGPNGTSE